MIIQIFECKNISRIPRGEVFEMKGLLIVWRVLMKRTQKKLVTRKSTLDVEGGYAEYLSGPPRAKIPPLLSTSLGVSRFWIAAFTVSFKALECYNCHGDDEYCGHVSFDTISSFPANITLPPR